LKKRIFETAMKQQLKNNIIVFSIILFYIAFAVAEVVIEHTYSAFIMLGLLFVVGALGYALGKWARDFKKLMDSLPADHKLVTQSVAAVDIGDFRFIYHVYEKGNGFSPASKSYLSMEVGIPFPEEGRDEGGYSARDSVRCDLRHLIDSLQEEGLLTGANPIVEDNADEEEDTAGVTWLGQPFWLEFPLKMMNPARLAGLQEKIMGIVNKYRLQDVSWCIIRGSEYGSEYRYYKGNLLQSTVLLREAFDRSSMEYKAVAPLQTGEFENRFSVDGYLELYSLASRDLGRDDLHVKDTRKLAKQMFKGVKNRNASVSETQEGLSVTVSIPKQMAASTYHLVKSGDRWWVYASGRLDNIDPISLDDESAACDLLLRVLLKRRDS